MLILQIDNLIGVIAVATYIYRRGATLCITSLILITTELPIGSERGLVRQEGVLGKVQVSALFTKASACWVLANATGNNGLSSWKRELSYG